MADGEPLSQSRINGQKEVFFCAHYGWAALSEAEADDLEKLRTNIVNGRPIPDRFYRAKIDTTEDRLLADHQIMHLHLISKTSNSLVYLIQFEDEVVFLMPGGHLFVEPHRSSLIAKAVREKRLAAKRAETRDKAKTASQKSAGKIVLKSRTPKPPAPKA